jgi:hypothetical protein
MAGVVMGWIGVGLGVLGICIACLFFILLPMGILGSINAGSGALLPLAWMV